MTEIKGEYNVDGVGFHVIADNTEAQYETLTKKIHGHYYRTPNKIFDYGLSPIAFMLYSYIRRVAGDNGACWQSASNIAKKLGISEGSVSNGKKELIEASLIYIEELPTNHGGKPYHNITVVDIWNVPTSPHELATSPHEVKNTTLRRLFRERE